ncbi:hypothetical protein [Kribbella monticola]|uniref:hypothetical protein n=1 Tax=Kribbella monticola TaxID=2185285 RepID=UPI00130023DA|nr:hypothetical protein [Kribbella monticola]
MAIGDGIIDIPESADLVALSAIDQTATVPNKSASSTLAFNVARWSDAAMPLPESRELTFERLGDLVQIAPGQEWSSPLKLVMASRTIPQRAMAIPLIAADEAAIIDLNAQNAWGPRPAMAPYEMASRLLMSYLSVGEHQIAGVMARALARALADERIIRWAEPSFAQLLVGYAFALSGDSLGLEAWCRRTVAVRFLGSDGVILAAESASSTGDSGKAAELLARAGSLAPPVMAFGLDLGVRLAFRLAGNNRSGTLNFDSVGPHGAALASLATSYSRLSTRSDPVSDTVTTPTSPRRPTSLVRSSWRTRASWALIFILTRVRYRNRLKAWRIHHVLLDRPLHDRRSSHDFRGATVTNASNNSDEYARVLRSRWEVYGRLVAGSLLVAWLGTLVATISFAAIESPFASERLQAPFAAVQGVVFVLVGSLITLATLERRTNELSRRTTESEERARAREDEAMKGRALAAALQAEAVSFLDGDVPSAIAHHARMSKALFGDLIGGGPVLADPGVGSES